MMLYYHRKCPKCGETNQHDVTFLEQQEQLKIICPVCKYTKLEQTWERTEREKGVNTHA
jgi:ssDNA-binding Zn-finger/Zn-ribbon topoisomerase 1